MSKSFIDTNVIVYANDSRDPVKHQRARALTTELIESRAAVVSTQVLHEFASVALAKLGQPSEMVHRALRLLELTEVVTHSAALIHRAIDLKTQHAINYWDACILAAAESAGCTDLYSEDLNAGQSYAGVRVVNPFAA
jgi:predicted nucleic acid-binding protein